MSKEDHIKIYFTTLLHEVIDSMDEMCDSLEWSEEKEFLTSMFLISFIGFSTEKDWRRDEIVKFSKQLSKELKEEDILIEQVKKILDMNTEKLQDLLNHKDILEKLEYNKKLSIQLSKKLWKDRDIKKFNIDLFDKEGIHL